MSAEVFNRIKDLIVTKKGVEEEKDRAGRGVQTDFRQDNRHSPHQVSSAHEPMGSVAIRGW